MENPKIALKQIISDEVTSIDKIKCSKCGGAGNFKTHENSRSCLLYTSDAADDETSVDLGGRRIIKKIKEKFKILSKPKIAI